MALKQVVCPECGKRLLLEVEAEGREYRCPVCGALFRAVRRGDALTVVFEGNGAHQESDAEAQKR